MTSVCSKATRVDGRRGSKPNQTKTCVMLVSDAAHRRFPVDPAKLRCYCRLMRVLRAGVWVGGKLCYDFVVSLVPLVGCCIRVSGG